MTPRTVARQAPLSLGFSKEEYWSGLPCPPPGDLPRDRACVSCIGRWILPRRATWEAPRLEGEPAKSKFVPTSLPQLNSDSGLSDSIGVRVLQNIIRVQIKALGPAVSERPPTGCQAPPHWLIPPPADRPSSTPASLVSRAPLLASDRTSSSPLQGLCRCCSPGLAHGPQTSASLASLGSSQLLQAASELLPAHPAFPGADPKPQLLPA